MHKTKSEYKTFGDTASLILSKAVNEASQSSPNDIVFDTYRENSIKEVERDGRQSNTGSIQLKNITAKQTVVQWKKFQQLQTKPVSLNFLYKSGKQLKYTEQLRGKVLYITSGQNYFKKSHTKEVFWSQSSALHKKRQIRDSFYMRHMQQFKASSPLYS